MNYFAIPGLKFKASLQSGRIEPGVIISIVVSMTGITADKMKGRGRYMAIVEARMICVWLIRKFTRRGLKDIGEIFYRDHTTVIHYLRQIKNRMETEPDFHKFVTNIQHQID